MIKSYTETTNKRAREMNAEIEQQRDTGLSSVRMTDDLSRGVQKTPFRVSLDKILDRIETVDYTNPARHPHMTICMVTMKNGFVIIGKSAPADPENYDQILGEQFSYEDALRQIWPYEAYLLRERMTNGV